MEAMANLLYLLFCAALCLAGLGLAWLFVGNWLFPIVAAVVLIPLATEKWRRPPYRNV